MALGSGMLDRPADEMRRRGLEELYRTAVIREPSNAAMQAADD